MTDITVRPFGRTRDGKDVKLFILKNEYVTAHFIEYGAVLQRLLVRPKNGEVLDLVLGYTTLAEYEKDTNCFGATVGRYCNRIRGGSFTIDKTEYTLLANEGKNTLHGGPDGFSSRVWHGYAENGSVCFTIDSEDGDQGFPGDLCLTQRISLEGTDLLFEYEYTCSKACPVSITHHSYLNLNGAGIGSAADHRITIYSDEYFKQDEEHISVYPPVPVEKTPFDFRKPAKISDGILTRVTQLRLGKGYDHCYPMKEEHFATVKGNSSKIVLDIHSDYPAVHFYDGNGIGRGGTIRGKGNLPYRKRYGICFEPEYVPNSPNERSLPSPFVKAGETKKHYIRYSFSAIEPIE